MAFKTLEDVNSSDGFAQIFVYVNEVSDGLFSNLLLFSLFVVIAMSSYFASQRMRGRADFKVSLVVAGFVTSGAGLIMLLVDGLVSASSVGIVIVITGIFAAILFSSSKD